MSTQESSIAWVSICQLDELTNDLGVCALVDGRQVAVFLVDGELYAIDNFDPFSQANVLARGLIGDVKGELVIIAPIYKQRFSLTTGQCQEDPEVVLQTYPVRVEGGAVQVGSAEKQAA